MDKTYVIYWSMTGNTLAMAQAIAKGASEAGSQAELLEVGSASVSDLSNVKGFAIGCPAMGAEVLEESEMEPFVEELESVVAGKTICLFGSYGWGDGQWLRDWVERMEGAGAVILGGEGIMAHETPDDSALLECESAGKQLAAL